MKYIVHHSGETASFRMTVAGTYASSKAEAKTLVEGWITRHIWKTEVDYVEEVPDNTTIENTKKEQ